MLKSFVRQATKTKVGYTGRSMGKLLIVDWDETLTTMDTTALVAEAAYIAKPKFRPSFNHFVTIYQNAYKKYGEIFQHIHGPIDSVEKEIEFQRGLYDVEMKSVGEISGTKLFQGVSKDLIRDQASKVTLRKGVCDFFRKAKSLDIPVYILSVNWCSTLINRVLKMNLIDCRDIKVFANDLEYAGDRATGQWDPTFSLRTGVDKLAYVKSWRNKFPRMIYVGDSSADLLPMLECDIAIAYEGSSILNKLKQLAIRRAYVREVADFQNNHIYVGTWEDIGDVLVKL